MKHIKLILLVSLISISQSLSSKLNAQDLFTNDTMVIKGDSFILRSNEFSGQIQWEESLNAVNWANIPNGNINNLVVNIDTSKYLRASIVDGTCVPIFSDTIFISMHSVIYDTIIDIRDSQIYKIIKIGKQWWMAENLNFFTTTGSSCYNEKPAYCDTFGRLYEWVTAMDGAPSSNTNPSGVRGICPAGWHLPSDAEWKELEMYLGMSQREADSIGWRGSHEGDKLKISKDCYGGIYCGISGFRGILGGYGYINDDWDYWDIGEWATFWSSTSYEYDPSIWVWIRDLSIYYSQMSRYFWVKHERFSIRCIKN